MARTARALRRLLAASSSRLRSAETTVPAAGSISSKSVGESFSTATTIPNMEPFEAVLGHAFADACRRLARPEDAEALLWAATARVERLQNDMQQMVTDEVKLGLRKVKELEQQLIATNTEKLEYKHQCEEYLVRYMKSQGVFSAKGLQEQFEDIMKLKLAATLPETDAAFQMTRLEFYSKLLDSEFLEAGHFRNCLRDNAKWLPTKQHILQCAKRLADLHSDVSEGFHSTNQTGNELVITNEGLNKGQMRALVCMGNVIRCPVRRMYIKP